MSAFEAIDVTKTFGGLTAVDRASISVPAGQITALIGPNGAGKTTFFNCMTGLLEPDTGRILLDGEDITDLPTHQRASRGLARTFQRLEVFAGLTVYENLQVAAEAKSPARSFRDVFRLRQTDDPDIVEKVDSVIHRLGLGQVARRQAGDLSTGMLRLVELGRALCIDPKVLLLDELASGLDEAETEELERVLVELAGGGIGILLIEHDIEMVIAVSHTVTVLDFGTVLAAGTPDEIVHNDAVRSAYLGTTA